MCIQIARAVKSTFYNVIKFHMIFLCAAHVHIKCIYYLLFNCRLCMILLRAHVDQCVQHQMHYCNTTKHTFHTHTMWIPRNMNFSTFLASCPKRFSFILIIFFCFSFIFITVSECALSLIHFIISFWMECAQLFSIIIFVSFFLRFYFCF